MTNEPEPHLPLPGVIRKKKCAKCKKLYPATLLYWYTNSASKDGFHSYCRACRREFQRKFWMNNYSKQGKLKREATLQPKYYLLLRDHSGGLPVILIYTAGGLNMGRLHNAIDGSNLPDEYANLIRLPDIYTSRTNLERQRARGLAAQRKTRMPEVVAENDWPDGTNIKTFSDGQQLVTAADGTMVLMSQDKAGLRKKVVKSNA